MKIFPLTAIAAFFTAVISLPAAVANGEQAPGFTLQTPGGETVSLSDHAGKYVILEWVNPGCPFVQKFYDAGAMQRFQEEAQSMGGDAEVVWLSINSTAPSQKDYLSAEDSQKYIKDKDVKSTWLLDPSGDVGRAYGATNTPHLYLINPEGKVVYQGAIDSIRSADAKDIERAENYILLALEASLDGREIETPRTRPYGCTMKY